MRADRTLRGDGTLDEAQRTAAEAALRTAARDVDRAVDTSHLSLDEATALMGQLERGWTTSHERAAMDKIAADAGLVSLKRTGTTLIGHARASGRPGEQDVVFRTEQPRFQSGEETTAFSFATRDDGGVRITVAIADTKERRSDLRDDFVEPLNQAFGLNLGEHATHGDGKGRHVEVTSALSGAAVAALAQVDKARLVAAGKKHGVNRAALKTLATELRAKDQGARALAVAAFLGETGGAGIATLRGLTNVAPPTIRSRSEGTQLAMQAAERALALYRDVPVRDDMSKRALIARLKTLDAALDGLAAQRVRVVQDPLLHDDDKAAQLEQIDALSLTIRQVVSFDDVPAKTRRSLHAKLDRGWTKLRHRGFQKRLSEGAVRAQDG